MELVEFRGNIFGKQRGQLYVFEPTWDSFRPISRIAWNGSAFVTDDQKYKTNLLSPYYGFESLQQKAECRQLLRETELGDAKLITDPVELWKWYGETTAKWWRDRPCVFLNSCVSRDDWTRYLKYLRTKHKTIRNSFKRQLTRRLVKA